MRSVGDVGVGRQADAVGLQHRREAAAQHEVVCPVLCPLVADVGEGMSAGKRVHRERAASATCCARVPAAKPWFCTSGCMRRIGIASRCALMPSPITRSPSVFFGRMHPYGRLTVIGWAACGASMKNCAPTVCPCVSKGDVATIYVDAEQKRGLFFVVR